METLVVTEHRNQYCNSVKPHGLARFGINCRNFQSGAGLLPTPFKYSSIHITKQPSSSFADGTQSKTTKKTPAIPINNNNRTPRNDKSFDQISGEGFMYSELWAGPANSISPPPSSLPVPKFSLRGKSTMSLELPAGDPVVDVYPTAKSAPASPTTELNPSVVEKTLRRILNLDDTDD